MSCIHPRGAARRHSLLRGGLIAAGATAALFMTAGPAAADKAGAEVVWLKPITIAVANNGNRYTAVEPSAGNIDGQIRVELDAGVLGRVASFDAWPLLHLGFGPGESETLGAGFKGTGMSKAMTYTSPRPKKVTETFIFSIPRARYQDHFVEACNRHADDLRGTGHSDSEIFAQDRSIKMIASASMSYKFTGPDRLLFSDGPVQITNSGNLDVVCKRLPPREVNPIAGASLLIRTEQAGYHAGACELRLHGTIATHVPNVQVKFRYVHGDGQESDLKTVATDAQGFVNFTHKYPLPAGIEHGKIRMVGAGPTFHSGWETYEADCGLPPQDKASVLPPKAAAIVFGVREEVAHRGLFCPSVIAVDGLLEGRGTASGAVALFANGQLKKLQQYSIEDGDSLLVQGEHTLTWGPTQAQQNVKLSMNVTNAKAAIVDQLEKTVNVTCRQVQSSGVAQGAVGGITTGKPAPTTHSYQAFAIQAPKGLVRQGQIRLSGGAANAKYSLKFLRKNGGGYVAVNATQLPKQMTGPVANFPLKALIGGRDWRLEVCPLGGTPAGCQGADFRLTRIGAGAKAPTPSPEQPQGSVFIFPGAVN